MVDRVNRGSPRRSSGSRHGRARAAPAPSSGSGGDSRFTTWKRAPGSAAACCPRSSAAARCRPSSSSTASPPGSTRASRGCSARSARRASSCCAAEAHDIAHDPSGWERRILSPVFPGWSSSSCARRSRRGVDAGEFAAHAPGSREYLAIERGRLRLTLDGVEHALSAGDSIYYAGDCRHGLRESPDDESCVYYLAMELGRHRAPVRPRRRPRRRYAMTPTRSDGASGPRSRALPPSRARSGRSRGRLSGRHPRAPGLSAHDAVERAAPDAANRSRRAAPSPRTFWTRVRADVLPHPMGNGHPRFFGWINSPPAPFGALAELLAAALNPSCAGGDHAAIYLERCVVRWLMELLGLPDRGQHGAAGQRRLDGLADLPGGGPPPGRRSATAGTCARTASARRRSARRCTCLAGGPQLRSARRPSCSGWARPASEPSPVDERPPHGRRRAPAGHRTRIAPPARARSAWPPAPAPASTGAIDPLDDARRPLRRGGALAPRRRRLRRGRRLRSGRRGALRRPRSRRLADARSAQVALGAGRVRRRAGPRRRPAPRDVQPGAAVPAHRGRKGVRRAALVLASTASSRRAASARSKLWTTLLHARPRRPGAAPHRAASPSPATSAR